MGGSLKIRGAYHKIYRIFDNAIDLNHKGRIRIVTSTMGNYGLACIEAYKRLRILKKFEALFNTES